MPFTLAPGITFCEVDGRRLFLDLLRDRYFCLGAAADSAFAALIADASLSSEQLARLEALRSTGLLRATATDVRPQSCRATAISAAPLDTAHIGDVRPGRIMRAAFALQRAKFDVRWRPLHRLCGGISATRSCLVSQPAQAEALATLAVEFQASGRLVGALDQCLALSLAIVRRALATGFPAELVFGVKLKPFQAHAWVQADGVLLSDRSDSIRPFTPILVI